MAQSSAGDVIPFDCAVIQVRVAELKQLFNAMDPSPFNDKDLDPKAEEFIVGWSNDFPINAHRALLIHLDRPAGPADEAAVLRDAIHAYFSQRALASRRRLRQLLRNGRGSLIIGLGFLAALLILGNLVATQLKGSGIGEVVRESMVIGGWVAMWRPLEVFLYDWWPIRAEARNFERLATMPVRIEYSTKAAGRDWRRDWPAVAPSQAPRVANQEQVKI